jgi:hypothetical protein
MGMVMHTMQQQQHTGMRSIRRQAAVTRRAGSSSCKQQGFWIGQRLVCSQEGYVAAAAAAALAREGCVCAGETYLPCGAGLSYGSSRVLLKTYVESAAAVCGWRCSNGSSTTAVSACRQVRCMVLQASRYGHALLRTLLMLLVAFVVLTAGAVWPCATCVKQSEQPTMLNSSRAAALQGADLCSSTWSFCCCCQNPQLLNCVS